MTDTNPHSDSKALSTNRLITSLSIPTQNRTDSLRKCLDSIVANNIGHNRAPQIIVIDSSTGQDTLIANEECIKTIGKLNPTLPPIDYIGPTEVDHLVKRIVDSTQLPLSLVTFALKGSPIVPVNTGASRNIHLLRTYSDLTLTVDDDVICQLYTRKTTTHSAQFISNGRSRNTFYGSRNELEASLEPHNEDLLAVHELALGRTIEECMKTLSGKIDIQGDGPINQKSAVAATVTGMAGNITSDSPIRPYYGALMAGTCVPSTQAEHHLLIESGQTIRLAERYIVGQSLLTSSYCLGLDNSVLLPPWLPILRSQDLVFGTLLAKMRPHTTACILPRAIWHDRPGGRIFSRPAIQKRYGWLTGGELIEGTFRRFSSDERSRELSLAALGNYLINFTTGDLNAFRNNITEVAVELIRKRIDFLQLTLEETLHYPLYIQKELQSIIAETTTALRTRDHSLVFDLETLGVRSPSALQQIFCQYGETIKYWAVIVDAAREYFKTATQWHQLT